jgi:hypothetical protein
MKKLWLERAGLALITVLAIGIPLMLILYTVLSLGDGIEIASGDPLREARLWMMRERRASVGIGLLTHATESAPAPGLQCARTYYRAVLWRPSLSIEGNSDACVCYELIDGKLKEAKQKCA